MRVLAVFPLVAAGVGCNKNSPNRNLLEDLLPPTPGQAARQAFSVDPDEVRKSIALLSRASFGGEEVYVRMYRVQSDHPDATVRALCISALGIYGTVEDVPLLIRRLSHDDVAGVRWEAAKALQKIHSQETVAALSRRIARERDTFVEPDANVREASAFALGQYPEPRVFDALVGALNDTEFAVVSAARRSLNMLTGYDFGNDGTLWLIWAKRHPDQLFDQRKQYTWLPYNKPLGLVDKLQFWKKRELKDPQSARGG